MKKKTYSAIQIVSRLKAQKISWTYPAAIVRVEVIHERRDWIKVPIFEHELQFNIGNTTTTDNLILFIEIYRIFLLRFAICCELREIKSFPRLLSCRAEKTKSIKRRLSFFLFLILFNFLVYWVCNSIDFRFRIFSTLFFSDFYFFLVKNYFLQWIFPKIPYYFNFSCSLHFSFHERKILSIIFSFCLV